MFGRARQSMLVMVVALAAFAASGLALGPSQDQSSPLPQATPPQDATQPLPLAADVTSGLLIRKVNPKYPKYARKERIQGVVVMNATITKNGDIGDLTLVSGHPLLAQASMDAVKQWKYHPYLVKGEPVDVKTQITVTFTLPRN